MRRRCLLNVVAILLQNATVITKCVGTRIFYFQHFLYEVHLLKSDHFVKSVQIRSFFWFVFSRTQAQYDGKIRNRKNSVFKYLCEIFKGISKNIL